MEALLESKSWVFGDDQHLCRLSHAKINHRTRRSDITRKESHSQIHNKNHYSELRFLFLKGDLHSYDFESAWRRVQYQLLDYTDNNIYSSLNNIAPNSELIDEIQNIWKNRQTTGWDGYNAHPITLESFEDTIKFLNILPRNAIEPEVVAENEGTLALEWQCGDSIFLISFQGSGQLIYAGDFEKGRRTRGYENFNEEIPHPISTIIETEFRLDR